MFSLNFFTFFFQTNNKTKGIGTRKAGKHNKKKWPMSKKKGKVDRMIGRHTWIKERLSKTLGRRSRTTGTKNLKGTLLNTQEGV